MAVSFHLRNLTRRPASTRCSVGADGFHSKTVVIGPIAPGHSSIASVQLTGLASAISTSNEGAGTYTLEGKLATVTCH
jgi:hypothetical protein